VSLRSACPNSVTWSNFPTFGVNSVLEHLISTCKSPIWWVLAGRDRTLEDSAYNSEAVVSGGSGDIGFWDSTRGKEVFYRVPN